MTSRRALLSLVFILTVSVCVTFAAEAAQSARQFKPCAVPGLDVVARCGAVEVLESTEQKTGRRIALRVIVVPAAADRPLPDPVLFLAGGPGQGAADLAVPLMTRIGFLRATRDLVFVDQRGTGASNPLTCAAPAVTSDLIGRIFDPQRLKACREQLEKRADLRQYTTAAAASDYAAVLDALGYRQVNVWGVSYGTRLALEIARRMPGRVRTLLLEAAVPLSFAWPASGAADADAALKALITDCETEPDCAASFPTLRRDVSTAFARVAKGSVSANAFDPARNERSVVSFGASDLAYATRGLLYGPDVTLLPRFFRAAASGRFDDFAQAYVTRARTIGQEIATGVHLGVYCSEDLPYVDMPAARKLAQGTRLGTYLLDQYAQACAGWPQGKLPTGFRDALRSDVPTLIMTGRRDPVTPPRTAHMVAKTLTRSRVVTWAAGGHGYDGLASASCRQSIIEAFVSSGQVERLPVGCAARERRRPFAR